MSAEPNLNYEKFEPSYDKNLNRKTGLEQPPRPSIQSPYELGPRVVSNQTFNDIWIQSQIRSTNYKPQTTGFRIDGRRGDIECKKIFTQDLNIGNRTIYVDVNTDLQQAIDNAYSNGGGKIIFKNSSYKPGKNITYREHVYFEGMSSGASIIDFENGAYGFISASTHISSAGTISIANGSIIVNGVGTSFSSSTMVGKYILLGAYWYPIVAVTGLTQLIIAFPYFDTTLAGSTYTIDDIIQDVQFKNLTIQNSTSTGIKSQYVSSLNFSDVNIINCTVGLDIDDVTLFGTERMSFALCGDAVQMTNTHLTQNTFAVVDSTNHGVVIDGCTRMTYWGSVSNNNGGCGIRILNSTNIGLWNVEASENGDKGFECVSGNNNISFKNIKGNNNTSDGLKLTATTDYCTIDDDAELSGNGGYGLNIAAASCDKNMYGNIVTVGNTAGTVQNLGTGTVAGTPRT